MIQPTKSTKRIWVLAAAVSAVAFSLPARAQYRIDTGHANDANNRAGSGGINEEGRVGRTATGNDIVTGNVTGGKEFRGHITYTDPRAFRGPISRPSDSFSRSSAASPYAGASANNASVVQPYYGDKQAAPPPPGFIRDAYGTTGYVPAPDPTRIGSDLRLGQVLDRPTVALPTLGTTILPGQVDASTGNSLITMSSLYGVRTWSPSELSDQQFMTRYGSGVFGENPMRGSLTDLEIGAMRRELQQSAGTPLSGALLNNALDNQNQNQTAPDPNNLAKPLPKPLESPDNSALSTGSLQASALGSAPLKGGLETGEGMQARLLVPPAAKQSAANELLQARLDEVQGKKPETDVDRAREFNKQVAAKQEAEKNGNTGPKPNPLLGGATPGPGATGATPDAQTPPTAVPGPTDTGTRKAPPQIKSFSEGVKAKGLADVMKKAEDLMKDGKWYSAIEQYGLARQVAPNNMLILVAQANAELGGSYYKPAEAHLRTAFTQDPATLEGQYDLHTMIGDERLLFLVKDLKDTATKNPTQPMAPFLLAYLSYNTGDTRMAAGYLDLAEKRAPATDTFYSVVRKHWVLPAKSEAPAPDLNK